LDAFRRYTNLAATIHLLSEKSITLLNPAVWDDKNDAYFMSEYKRHKNAKTVLAICFAECPETYHHWRVFSHGPDGVCIEFEKNKLLEAFNGDSKIKMDAVEYELIKDAGKQEAISLERLPFLKRYPYRDEQEYRIIYVDDKKSMDFKSYPIELGCIRRITLSPWIAKNLGRSVKDVLKYLSGHTKIEIARSTLTNNEKWRALTEKVSK
jgi:hypothetical protein